MTKKEKYELFCEKVYVPIYSKNWWLDAVCGAENWDVLLYESGNEILAAMPYYTEMRGRYRYITKALLTQNNGIIFRHPEGAKKIAVQKYEEQVIQHFCDELKEMKLDVYEQQYQTSFTNWLPFYWNGYMAIPRYTYRIENTDNIELVWENISSKYKGKIKKGQKDIVFEELKDEKLFYFEHEKIFHKQGLLCPFSYEQWCEIYVACKKHNACKMMCAKKDGNIASVLFLIWDDKAVYQLLGGSMPEYQMLDTYDALIWEGIKFAVKQRKIYDFEGSVIKRISKSFREFGGEPKQYFRIRKVFNPEIVLGEAQQTIERGL